MAPSLVVSDMPLSLVTEPGLARVPDDERAVTTMERDGCKLCECLPEGPRSEWSRPPLGACCGGKVSTDAKPPAEGRLKLGCDRSSRPKVSRCASVATAVVDISARVWRRRKLKLGVWEKLLRIRKLMGVLETTPALLSGASHHQGLQFQLGGELGQVGQVHHGWQNEFHPLPMLQNDGPHVFHPKHQSLWHQPSHHQGFQT